MHILSILLCLLVLSGCGSKKSMIVNTRDKEFYSRFVNSTQMAPSVESKLTSVKLLETGKDYPMRFVLFDNGTFYYQVHKLGNGNGKWSYQSGALELIATRSFFDLTIYLSAAKSEGDEILFRFIDRFGMNSVPTELRVPVESKPPLEEFTQNDKGL